MKITKLHAENVHGYLPLDVSFFDDITFLFGLNGSGKTSALRLLMALLTPNINELNAIYFSLAEVTVFDDGSEIVISAIKNEQGIELKISSISESLHFSKAELELLLETKRGDEPRLQVREIYQSNPVLNAISKMSTPMFLGLDRKFFVPGANMDDFDDLRRREYMMARRVGATDSSVLRGVSPSANLGEVNYFVTSLMRRIRADQEKLDEELRRDFFKKAFEYKPRGLEFEKTPSTDELESYRKKLRKFEDEASGLKIPAPEIQAALASFLERMTILVDSLNSKKKNKKPQPTHSPSNEIEWFMNKPQADRIVEHLDLLNQYIENRNKLREPIERFVSLVNTFLIQTRKSIYVDDNEELRVRVNGNPESRSTNTLSSGERQLLVMLAHLSLNPNLVGSGVFIVDEPELSLHIAWQEKFVDAIREANPKVQLILATHSPAIILDRLDACRGLDEVEYV